MKQAARKNKAIQGSGPDLKPLREAAEDPAARRGDSGNDGPREPCPPARQRCGAGELRRRLPGGSMPTPWLVVYLDDATLTAAAREQYAAIFDQTLRSITTRG